MSQPQQMNLFRNYGSQHHWLDASKIAHNSSIEWSNRGCEISFTVIDIIYIGGTRCIYTTIDGKKRAIISICCSRMHPLSLYFMIPHFLILILGLLLAAAVVVVLLLLPSTFYLNSLVFSFSFYLYFTIISF